MLTINQFFNNLDNKIRNAKTERALRILNRRGNKFIRSLKTSQEKQQARVRFSNSKQLIAIRRSQIS